MHSHLAFVLALGLVFWTVPSECQQRIIGGSLANIQSYPYAAALLHATDTGAFVQSCAGSILNNRAILSAAHCFAGETVNRWRIRVGSTYANSGGVVHYVQNIIIHNNYNARTYDNDIAIIRSPTQFSFNNNVRVASIAGTNYYLPDNQAVWAIGWGSTSFGGQPSELLRHVQVWTVNQITCRNRYAALGYQVTDNMLCSGWLDVGGRDQCQDDAGGPLIHNNVVVGICSWGHECGLAKYPGVNTRVSRYVPWIQANA